MRSLLVHRDVNDVDIFQHRAQSVNMQPMTVQRYHHGDLAAALVDAGFAACRAAGPGGLILRELAGRIGVSPAAAYRHFASIDHLRAAVAQRSREELARRMMSARMTIPTQLAAADRSRRRLSAMGSAYVAFALEEPRLFDTAFAACGVRPERPDDPDAWRVLTDAIDEMIASGATPEALRAEAPWIAWSAVHGLASILVNDTLPEPADVKRMIEGVLRGVERALT
jgi:AcrR family transcriptional regulator